MDDFSKSITFGWSGKVLSKLHQNLPVNLSTLQTFRLSNPPLSSLMLRVGKHHIRSKGLQGRPQGGRQTWCEKMIEKNASL
jgi:hypothetical protein